MSLYNLNNEEIAIVGECLKAAVYGPFFDNEEFYTLFGVYREEAKTISDTFPEVDESDDEADGNDNSWLVINNTFANLLGYPHGMESEWPKYISASKSKVSEIFKKWRE